MYSRSAKKLTSGHSKIVSVDQGFCFPCRGILRRPFPEDFMDVRRFWRCCCSLISPLKQSFILCWAIMRVSIFKSLSLALTFWVRPIFRSMMFEDNARSIDSSLWSGFISFASVDCNFLFISASRVAEKSFRSYSLASGSPYLLFGSWLFVDSACLRSSPKLRFDPTLNEFGSSEMWALRLKVFSSSPFSSSASPSQPKPNNPFASPNSPFFFSANRFCRSVFA